MTDDTPVFIEIPDIATAFAEFGKLAAEFVFRTHANAALNRVINDQLDQAAALIDAMTEDRRAQLWMAACAFANLVGSTLNDDRPEDPRAQIAERLAEAWPHIFDDLVFVDQVAAVALSVVMSAGNEDLDAIDRISALADHLDQQAGPDSNWSVRAKDAASRIRAALRGDQ